MNLINEIKEYSKLPLSKMEKHAIQQLRMEIFEIKDEKKQKKLLDALRKIKAGDGKAFKKISDEVDSLSLNNPRKAGNETEEQTMNLQEEIKSLSLNETEDERLKNHYEQEYKTKLNALITKVVKDLRHNATNGKDFISDESNVDTDGAIQMFDRILKIASSLESKKKQPPPQ